VTIEQYKMRFITAVLGVWAIVVGASLFVYLFRAGEQPQAWLLGIPTGTWLAVFPPLPKPKE
jgi:uncharacterized membrane protein HdeD (DUF308 family)